MARAADPERTELARDIGDVVVGPSELSAVAEALAAERAAERVAHRSRLDAAVARLEHDVSTATSRLEHLEARRAALLDGADWASATEADLTEHTEAVAAARAELEARQAEQRAAVGRLERVLEQRAAASAAMEDADRQLAELVGVGMDETGLRRELEAAGHAVRAAHDAHRAAVEQVHELEAARADVEQRAADLRAASAGRAGARLHADLDIDRVRDALADWQESARHAGVDPAAQKLADAFADLHADLADLHDRLGPRPDERDLQAAQARADAAAVELERLEAAAAGGALSTADRAELDAAHEKLLAAEERTDRRIGAAAARRQVEVARAKERELLDRFGFGSYLDVVLSGGRAATETPERLAAERTYLAAKAARDALRRALQPSPELEYLESERTRLLGHAVDLLGVDPGDDLDGLLRAHPLVPRPVVASLGGALERVGIRPVGVGLADAAEAWLREQAELADHHRRARDEASEVDAQLAELHARGAELDDELDEARAAEARAEEELELAGRSVGAFENELSVRAGEDTTRLKRFAAAEQLRHQVEALASTLARAEHDARGALDQAAEATAAAEAAFDRVQGALTDLGRRARALAEELPIDERPAGDPLTTLGVLAERLRGHAEVVQPELDAAGTAVATARARVDEASVTAAAAGDGTSVRDEDIRDGLLTLLSASDETVIVLDDPFRNVRDDLRPLLLDAILGRPGAGSLVLLTDEAAVLGWAIELPADQGTVAPADSLLNLGRRQADIDRASLVEMSDDSHSSDPDPTAPTSSAHRWAGRR